MNMVTGLNAPVFTPKNADFAARCRDSFSRQAFMDTLGVRMAVIEPGYCELHIDNQPGLTQQHGFVHGGVLATLADCAAGYAAFSLMPPESTVLTVEYKLNIVRPGAGDTMVAKARVVKPGRTLDGGRFGCLWRDRRRRDPVRNVHPDDHGAARQIGCTGGLGLVIRMDTVPARSPRAFAGKRSGNRTV